MTQEDKKLLLRELSARLPYGVKVTWDGKYPLTVTPHIYCAIASEDNINNLPKLLLRPMSSMTEEEKKELLQISNFNYEVDEIYDSSIHFIERAFIDIVDIVNFINWLNAHHFDYRGLIEKGLAIKVTKDNNPYKE